MAATARDWADGVIADLKARSPLSLKVTHRHIREARALDLRQTLSVDYRLACRFLDGHDFYEGVRAALIDKDGKPRWQPRGSRTSRRRWSKIISRRWARTSWRCRRARRCRPRACNRAAIESDRAAIISESKRSADTPLLFFYYMLFS